MGAFHNGNHLCSEDGIQLCVGAIETEVISVQKTESNSVLELFKTEIISVLKTESNCVWVLLKTEVISVQKTESSSEWEPFQN